ncbi:unnamed protein product [Amoebophrya sp. A120]|nr:unnamed protein product [Amoebophrya sp. A120]|eukprot:GSA120T00008215001.1
MRNRPSTALACLLAPCFAAAERFWLHRVERLPEPRTFEIVHYHTVEAGAEVSLQGPIALEGIREKLDTKIQLHLLHSSLMGHISADHFCCSKQDVAEKKCATEGTLMLTDGPDALTLDAKSFSPSRMDQYAPWKVKTTGLYFLAISNCGETDFSSGKFTSGEISVMTKAGYLPAEEKPKMAFYMYLALGYVGLLCCWAAYCWAWTDVLFLIHHFISCALICGALEATCWFTSLAHWNWTGHRWWSMIALATLGTTIKQGVCYALLLLACLGVGVTQPKPSTKTLMQIFALTVAFVVTDTYRQFAMAERSTVGSDMTTFSTVLVVAPGSFFVSCLYVWILQALQETISELNSTKQIVKAELYRYLRLALGSVCAVVIALVAYETAVVRQTDLSQNWDSRWIFTDAASHCMFFFLSMVLMYLWRPNETSQQIAYSQQIGDDDGIELGNRMDMDLDEEEGVSTLE